MGNFLGNLGAAFRGQQDYSDWENKNAEAKQRLAYEKMRMAELQQLTADNAAQRKRQPDVDQGVLDYLAKFQNGIPKPPAGADMAAQAPEPGQASVPMIQPGQQPPRMGPPDDAMPPRMGIPPPPQGMPPQGQMPPPAMAGMQGAPMQRQMAAPPPGMMPPEAPPGMPPGAPPQGMQGPAPLPPYKTVGGAPAPQQAPPGIPRPPMQQPPTPALNSMSIQDAAQFIQSRGISDPKTSMQILEKLTPYLDNDAKRETAIYKSQLAHMEKVAQLEENIRHHDQLSKDKRFSTEEQAKWHAEAAKDRMILGRMMASIGQQNANTNSKNADTRARANNGEDKLTEKGMAVQMEMAKAGANIPKDKRGEVNWRLLNALGDSQEGGAGSGSIVGSQADYKANKSTYGAVQKRTAGIELGVKKLEKDIQLLESTMADGNAGFASVINKPLNYLRTKGSDPKLAAYALAASNVAVEFERLRTGGMLSAAQLHAGAQEDAKKIINGDMSVGEVNAVLPVMLQEIENGRQAATEVEKFYRDKLHGAKEEPAKPKAQAMTTDRWNKMKSGDTFIDENGNTRRKP